GLNLGRLALDLDGLARAAHLDDQGAGRDTLTGADGETLALQHLERRHRHFNRVRVGRDARNDEIASAVGDRWRGPGGARLTDERDGRAWDDAALGVFYGA